MSVTPKNEDWGDKINSNEDDFDKTRLSLSLSTTQSVLGIALTLALLVCKDNGTLCVELSTLIMSLLNLDQ
jgi:hypothetical protein